MTRPARARRVALVRRRIARSTWRVLKLVVACVAVSLLLGGGAFATTSLYEQYGAPRTAVSERAWAERSPTYLVSDCRACHADRSAEVAGAAHQGLICETCHVPRVEHPGDVAGVVLAMSATTSAQCVTCHTDVPGLPAETTRVVLDEHYPGALCLACHEPHTSVAIKPPIVTHPLANLPDCVTCHAPGGLKRFPSGHETAADQVCRSCHLPGVSGR